MKLLYVRYVYVRKIEHNAKGSNSEYSTILYAPYTHNSTRFQHDYPKMKQTKIVLRNIYYSPQSKAGVCLNYSRGVDPMGSQVCPETLRRQQNGPLNLFILHLQVCYIFGLPHDLYLGTLSMRTHLLLFSAIADIKNRAI